MSINAMLFLIPLISSILTFVFLKPFIDFMYRINVVVEDYSDNRDLFGEKTVIFNSLHAKKKGTPRGAGAVIILVVLPLTYIFLKILKLPISGLAIVSFLLLTFMVIGFFDDYNKTRSLENSWNLKFKYKLYLELLVATIVSHIVVGEFSLIWILISLLVPFLAESFNISDGLDGLSCGMLAIILLPIIYISMLKGNYLILIISLSIIGALISFLYFNINPARILLGDVGSLPLGAFMAFAVVSLNIVYLVPILYILVILDSFSSLAQLFSKKFFKKKIFLIAPIHHHFEALGWPETKVVFRFWVIQALFSFLSLFVFHLVNGKL